MRKIVAILAALVTPAVASSDGVDLSWVECVGSPSASHYQGFVCTGTINETYRLVLQFKSPVTIENVTALNAYLTIDNEVAGPLAPFWHYESGGCNSGNLGISIAANISQLPYCAANYQDLYEGSGGAAGIAAFAANNPSPGQGRFITFMLPSGGPTIEAGLNYYAAHMTFTNRRRATCAGCSQPVLVKFDSLMIERSGGPSVMLRTSDKFSQCASINGATLQCGVQTFPIQIDARTLADTTFRLAGGCMDSRQIQTVQLTEGVHTLDACSGGCGLRPTITFSVDANGLVQYDPELEPAVDGDGTSTLIVRSFSFPPRADDLEPSMGLFSILPTAQFTDLAKVYPGWTLTGDTYRMISPRLYDPNTRIGRSSLIHDGDNADENGTPVGSAGTIISDAHMPLRPAEFNGPPNTAEIHTELRYLHLGSGSGVAVRAGTAAPGRPISPGEVQSTVGATGLYPAMSFFNVFPEVDLPQFAGLSNLTLYAKPTEPLLIDNTNLLCLPPRVVYLHRHSGPVGVYCLTDDTQNPKRWVAGDRFGWLVLAGHGINFDTVATAPSFRAAVGREAALGDPFDEFLQILSNEPEMADSATLAVDVINAIQLADAEAFVDTVYQDSLMNALSAATAAGQSGNPCGGVAIIARANVRVDGSPTPSDWVTDPDVRGRISRRLVALGEELQIQANQSGGCVTGVRDGRAPRDVTIQRIHPNPTRGSARIDYTIPRAGRVELSIYDLGGRRIAQLVDAELRAGTYHATWNGFVHQGRRAPSGVFFARLSACGETITARLSIVQ